jgi:hypothetical protein
MEKVQRFGDGCSWLLPLTITDDLFRGFQYIAAAAREEQKEAGIGQFRRE